MYLCIYVIMQLCNYQGCIMTGIWVLAHECGHGGFSASKAVNDVVGTIFHSLLLVPYHPWRITHARHHKNTGSCEVSQSVIQIYYICILYSKRNINTYSTMQCNVYMYINIFLYIHIYIYIYIYIYSTMRCSLPSDEVT